MSEAAISQLFYDCPYPMAVLDVAGQLILGNSAWESFWDDWQNGNKEVKPTWLQWLQKIIADGSSYKDFYSPHQIMRLHASFMPKEQRIRIYGQELTEGSQIDNLTNFPRQFLLKQRLASHLQAMTNVGSSKTVLVILDIKDFKEINLRYSYATGDAILMELAERLRKYFPEALCMGRIAGNEFAIAYDSTLTDFATLSDLDARLGKLQTTMTVDGSRIQMSLVTGVVVSDDSMRTPDQLLAQAQLALNQARDHKLKQQVYCPKLAVNQHRKLCIREELDSAIANGQFYFVYEPQVDLTTGAIVGAEVLARWQHPTLGAISPLEFIPVAEKTGKIGKLTCFLIEHVFDRLRMWHLQGIKLVPIAVNISAQDLLTDDLVYLVTRLAQESPKLLRYLQLEITETYLLRDISRTLNVLEKVKQLGITISIDDFGTGYSSLSYLSRLAADKLKIDRSFISNLFLCPNNEAIVQSILDLAKRLQMQVCAEGVETKEQCQYLLELGCRLAQGYYFCKSLVENDFVTMLRGAAASFSVIFNEKADAPERLATNVVLN